jgi:sec-independent protein translocase protein TatA
MNFLPGPMELVLILIIVAMLFGVGKLPEVFGAVGKGIKEFRKEAGDELSPGKSKATVTETPPAAPVVTTIASTENVDNTVKAP